MGLYILTRPQPTEAQHRALLWSWSPPRDRQGISSYLLGHPRDERQRPKLSARNIDLEGHGGRRREGALPLGQPVVVLPPLAEHRATLGGRRLDAESRNPSPAATSIAKPSESVACTMTGAIAFGRMCQKMMALRRCPIP